MSGKSWLAYSLLLNLALATVVVLLAFRAKPARRDSVRTPGEEAVVPAWAGASTPAYVTNAVEIEEAFNWAQIESADYKVYADNLRRAGCPESTVRDILVADVDALFRGRVRDYVAQYQNSFWALMAAPDEVSAFINARSKELNALEKQRDELLEAVLDGSAPSESRKECADLTRKEERKFALDFLPAEKLSACLALEQKYAELLDRTRYSTNKSEVKQLEQQRDQALQGLLSAEEYAEYQLRASPSGRLPSELRGFAASASEVREICRIQEKFRTLRRTPESEGQRKAELEAVLGEQRAAEFELALKPDYRDTCVVVQRYQLPPQAARDVYALRTTALEQAKGVKADASVSPEEKLVRLAALRAEAERSLAQTLGEDAFEAYSSRFSGNWLSQLEQLKR